MFTSRFQRSRMALILLVLLSLIGGACGGDSAEDDADAASPRSTPVPPLNLSQPRTGTGEIAFVCDSGAFSDLCLMNADGTNPRNLTGQGRQSQNIRPEQAWFHSLPTWSPDGSRIAYVLEWQRNTEIYVINADGSARTNLTNDAAHDTSPVWSPDGSRLLFVSERTGNFDVFVMNADGSAVRNLTQSDEYEAAPAWSPDGTQIAFTRLVSDDNAEIFVMNADGSAVRNLTNHADYDLLSAWSPDGTQIAFMTERDGNREIYVMNADGSDPHNVSQRDDYDSFGIYDNEIYALYADSLAFWSPNGGRAVFAAATRGYNEYRDIVVINPDGTDPINLTLNVGVQAGYLKAMMPLWSLDGTQIVFTTQHVVDVDAGEPYFDLWIVNADGTGLLNLTNSPATDEYHPVWRPAPR